jgi:Xaa-Pro aminopeptidase
LKYNQLPSQLFIENRQRFTAQLKPKSVAIFNSNDVLPTNADGTMGFRQQTDLFYLSGIDQEESILVLAPNHPDPKLREVLFLRETSELIAIWEGYKYTKAHAKEVSGIGAIYWMDSFENVLKLIVFESEYIYLNQNEHLRNGSQVQTRDDKFVRKMFRQFPLHKYERIAPILHQLRMIKSSIEVAQLKEACRITELGFKRVLNFTKPGVTEYEIEAEFIHEFTRNRSKGFSYTPIIASGANAICLHYIENKDVCKDGDLILLDVGAEYANYAADMTRTIPVNGKFTARQKQVYEAVLRTNKFAESLIVPGTIWDDLQKEVEMFIQAECIGLGLFTNTDVSNQNPEAPLFKKYFMHGNTHSLGLDVHDVWNKYRPFEAGMVFTNEPGIYIKEEGIGVRLENDILITATGNINLMANIPIEIEEIEQIMNS